jgi:hypothetical protein
MSESLKKAIDKLNKLPAAPIATEVSVFGSSSFPQ